MIDDGRAKPREDADGSALARFLKEYRYYFLGPFVIVLLAWLSLIFLTDDSAVGQFIYAIF